MLTLKVAAILETRTLRSSGENELICLTTTAGRPDEDPWGVGPSEFVDQIIFT